MRYNDNPWFTVSGSPLRQTRLSTKPRTDAKVLKGAILRWNGHLDTSSARERRGTRCGVQSGIAHLSRPHANTDGSLWRDLEHANRSRPKRLVCTRERLAGRDRSALYTPLCIKTEITGGVSTQEATCCVGTTDAARHPHRRPQQSVGNIQRVDECCG